MSGTGLRPPLGIYWVGHMARDTDAVRTAETLVRLYGDRAETEARDLWHFYRRTGATNAARVWQRVLTTLAALRAQGGPILH